MGNQCPNSIFAPLLGQKRTRKNEFEFFMNSLQSPGHRRAWVADPPDMYRDCALAVLKDHTWNSIEEEEAAYLLLPYAEESYQAISAILDKRLKEFLEAEFEDDPELRVARAADGKPPIIPDWAGPLYCFATNRIAQEGYKIKVAERVAPEREEWGWDTGWGFFSDDDDEIEDDENGGFYDIRDICRIDPTVVPLLSLPYGTCMEKDETGEWIEIEDDETERS